MKSTTVKSKIGEFLKNEVNDAIDSVKYAYLPNYEHPALQGRSPRALSESSGLDTEERTEMQVKTAVHNIDTYL